MILLGQRMIGSLQPEVRTPMWFLNVSVHLQTQGIWIFRYPGTQPREHWRNIKVFILLVHAQERFKVRAA